MTKGIKVVFKDGTVDYFDPCDEIYIRTGYVSKIDGAPFEYAIKVDEIADLSTYKVEEE